MRIPALRLEKGIDSVTHVSGEDAASHLPEGYLVPTPGENIRPHIAEVLEATDTAQYLLSQLRPSITDRDLLTPARFRAVLIEAQQALLLEAGQNVQSRALNRAVRLLNEDKGLRDLLQMYRSALYQG
jgi:type III secretion protein X